MDPYSYNQLWLCVFLQFVLPSHQENRMPENSENLKNDPVTKIEATKDIVDLLARQRLPIIHASQLVGFYLYADKIEKNFTDHLVLNATNPDTELNTKKAIYAEIAKWCDKYCQKF